ncbi:hypothetical protein VNO77_27255 [Canavalia gladiata]|uniref:Uncharacterized protein n=1 Tax=Canavalia gladiata TaxID=3824 RepID=A0AAN9Q6Y3_CANGL
MPAPPLGEPRRTKYNEGGSIPTLNSHSYCFSSPILIPTLLRPKTHSFHAYGLCIKHIYGAYHQICGNRCAWKGCLGISSKPYRGKVMDVGQQYASTIVGADMTLLAPIC